jgi:hypothetical protein
LILTKSTPVAAPISTLQESIGIPLEIVIYYLSYILSVGNDCLLKKINFRTREVAHTVDLLDPTYAIAVHPDNKNLIYIGKRIGHSFLINLRR